MEVYSPQIMKRAGEICCQPGAVSELKLKPGSEACTHASMQPAKILTHAVSSRGQTDSKIIGAPSMLELYTDYIYIYMNFVSV